MDRLHLKSGARLLGSELFADYERWCVDNDVVAVSNLAFHKAVPLDKERKSGRLYYLGVKLASAKGCLRIAVDNTPRRALGRKVVVQFEIWPT